MQSTVVRHKKDGGASGGVFESYNIIKVGGFLSCCFAHEMVSQVPTSVIGTEAFVNQYWFVFQIQRVVNKRLWDKYVYRRREVSIPQ